MIILLGLMLIALTIAYSRKRSVQADYVFFCLVFMLLFYILPALLISSEGAVSYGYRIYNFSTSDINFIAWGLIVFLLGFFLVDFMIARREMTLRKRRHFFEDDTIRRVRYLNPAVLVGLLIVLAAILVYMLFIGYSSTAFAVRSGLVQGNYLIMLLLSGCLVTTIFCMAAMERAQWYYKIIPVVLVIGFSLQLGGRTTLLFSIAYVGIMFGLNLKRAVMLSLLFFPLLLPLIRDGKTLIYAVATGYPLSEYQFSVSFDYMDIANLYFDTIITNFAHPVISLVTAPLLVESIGYRYFYDYLHGFLFYARVIGIDAGDSLTYYNTEVILGDRRSTIPTGYLAFGYVQASIFGIFVSGCFFRWLGYAALRFLHLTRDSSLVLRFHITLICSYSFYIGEIRTMVITVFFPILVIKLLQRLGRI